jgi:hypothetical protein
MLYDLLLFFSGDENTTCAHRSGRALRYAIIAVVILIIIFVVGFFIKTSPKGKSETWVKDLFGQQNIGDKAIEFLIAVIMLLGLKYKNFLF